MKNIHKNLFGLILIIVLTALLGAGLILPRSAGAAVPVEETNDDMLDDIETSAEKLEDILEQMQEEWDFFKNNEETKWEYFKKAQDKINEGLKNDGNPMWIQDYADYLSAPGAKTAKVFYSELDKDFLCESFNSQIKQMFNPGKTVKFSEKGPGGAGCTITDTVGDINAFYDDFSQGGWQAWNQIFEPQNNIFGAYLLASEELTIRQNIANKSAQTEALANQGYLSNRGEEGCEEEVDGICVRSSIGIPGYNYAEQAGALAASEFLYISSAGDLEPYSEDVGDTFLDRIFNEIAKLFGEIIKSGTQPKPPADDPCANVKILGDEAYNACKKLNQSGTNIKESIRQSGIDEIQRAINFKTQALNYKQSTVSLSNNLIAVLNDLLNCQTAIGSPNQSQTQAKINATQQLRTAVSAEIPVLQGEIAGLNNEINVLKSLNDQTEIIMKIKELEGAYDTKGARQQKNDAQYENETVSADLNRAQNDRDSCLNQLKLQQQQQQQQQGGF